MKKLVLTIAIVLGMTFGASAQFFGDNEPQQKGGGLFGYGQTRDVEQGGPSTPLFPTHGQTENQDALPLGSGALLLIGFGAAYAAAKRRKE